jgi:multidrug efflux pump subunit AcrA (membrane-fusion protein)
MRVRERAMVAGIVLGLAGSANAQATGNPNQIEAKVEQAPLYLTAPDRYRVPSLVEPLRKVAVMAPSEGVLKGISVPVGSTVREGEEIARLDANGALARLKIAMASVKEMQAEYEAYKKVETPGARVVIAEARLDAAKARVELAQMEVDSCTLRAPFSGRIMAILVSPGQYLAKGSTILDLADVSSVRVLLPVDRTAVSVGGSVNFTIEGTGVTGKAQAVLPLTEAQATLRELVAPLSAAWIVVNNPSNTLEPGQRAQSPYLPNAPISGVPSYSIHKGEDGSDVVQVIRAERVTEVPIRILGVIGPDRTQVSGPFRASDVLLQSSSVPIRPGTFIRFNSAQAGRRVEGQPPTAEQIGEAATLAPPVPAAGRPTARPTTKPAAPATTKPAAPAVPF